MHNRRWLRQTRFLLSSSLLAACFPMQAAPVLPAAAAPPAEQMETSLTPGAPTTPIVEAAQPGTEQVAQEYIAAKRFADARAVYQTLSEREPDNMGHKIWIARLSAWLQEYDVSLAIYDAVLARDSANIEALIGKSTVLMWRQEYSAAEPLITRAIELAPQNPEAHLARARWHFYQGQARPARAAVERALALDPQNEEAKKLAAQIALPRPWQAQIGYERFNLSSGPSGDMKRLSIGHVTERQRAMLHYERWNRFDQKADRIGGELSRRAGENLWLHGGVFAAPGATIIPRQEYRLGASNRIGNRLALRVDYRFVKFMGGLSHIVGPTLEYYRGNGDWLQASLSRSWTSFQNPPAPRAANTGYSLRYNRQVSEPILVYLAYARGTESSPALSIDRLTSFSADTIAAGLRWRLSETYSLDFYGARQNRSNDTREDILGMSLTARR